MGEREVARVVYVDYEDHDTAGLVARVSCRTEAGERRNVFIKGTEPWMFVHEDADVPEEDCIKRVEDGYESVFDDRLKKIVTEVPKDVNSKDGGLVDHFDNHFEADLPYYRRLSTLDGLHGYIELPKSPGTVDGMETVHIDEVDVDPNFPDVIEPRVCLADIEVHMSEDDSFEETRENASEPINVICAYDNHEKDYTVFFLNEYDNLSDPEKIREIIREQWDGEDGYADCEIEMVVAADERSLLNDFIDYCNERRFDLISGWNFVDFDYEYLINRMRDMKGVNHHALASFGSVGYSRNDQMKIPGLPAFDMMEAFCDKMTYSEWRSKALDYVAQEELGVGKLEHVDINYLWEHNPEKLIAYNIVDVQLTVALDEANDIHASYYNIADESGIPIYDTMYEKRLVDGYILSRRRDDEVLPSADEAELPDNAGGFVAEPAEGIHERIGVVDLKSLYPSAMITWNISTETVAETPEDFDNYVQLPKAPAPKDVVGRIEEENIEWDWLYCSLDQEGIIPRTVKRLFKDRNRAKARRDDFMEGSDSYQKFDRLQAAIKVIMNSFYGVSSSKYWRLSNKYMGDAVTSAARYTLWFGAQGAREYGYDTIYSDTDSHFLQLERDTLEGMVNELYGIEGHMNEYMDGVADEIGLEGKHPYLAGDDLHGTDRTCLYWEAEKIYEAWMQLGKKKRYAGNIVWKEGKEKEEPETSVSGFESQRADSTEMTAEVQETVLEMILSGGDFKDISSYVQENLEALYEGDELRQYAIPAGLNKPPEQYPNRPVPRAAEYSNEWLGKEYGEGDDFFVYYVDRVPSGYPNTDVIALDWNEGMPEGFEVDIQATVRKAFELPLEIIVEEVGWSFDEVKTGKEVQSLDLSGVSEIEFEHESDTPENETNDPDVDDDEPQGVLDF